MKDSVSLMFEQYMFARLTLVKNGVFKDFAFRKEETMYRSSDCLILFIEV